MKKTLSNEFGAEVEPNTIENQDNNEPLGEISDDEDSSNEQSKNEEGKTYWSGRIVGRGRFSFIKITS